MCVYIELKCKTCSQNAICCQNTWEVSVTKFSFSQDTGF